ncbi:transcriptional regulator, AraC family with amidase-like domain [Cohaesibacter sp. ES.047]|uniref:GlxA family transcriptional regulator n=1 Tax=Cohaesibacter sp. ES.047 TaxID=1798205 RepID=UPI000BB7C9BE|nr:GlxA family transcriptional regulator [Cohaesibacter sp. ES.047]SNY94117.1 transcriptional regulator, AraC family with amidase-like domain [Cohaesibacter sp. ES.047]
MERTINPTRPSSRGDVRLRVGFILSGRFTLCAFANFVDVLRLAADDGDRSRPIFCNWSVLSHDMSPVSSSCGVRVSPNERLGNPKDFDYIVVVGGVMDETPDLNPAYTRYLKRAANEHVPLVGVCTGAFLLHQAGLLDGFRCCVSWFHDPNFLEQFDGLNPVSNQIFVVDRDRLTCSGGASSAHLAAYLVDKHVGRAQAQKSLRIMIIDGAQDAEMPQPGVTLEFRTKDPLVHRTLLIMQQNIDTPLTIKEIAKRIGESKRRIERHFRAELDMSPQAAFLSIRLSFAHHLVTSTQKSVARIAVDSGFCDASHLSRFYKQRFGATPHAIRQQPEKHQIMLTG